MNKFKISILSLFTMIFMGTVPSSAIDLSGFDPEKLLVINIESPSARGDVVIMMRPDLAPNHIKRIKELARQKFYDGIVFHRVLEDFMAQTGDPLGNGTGGSGKNLEPEFSRTPHLRGTVSMARSAEENSADSQFFICLSRAAFLDNKYTVWGRVVSGMEYVDAIPLGEPAANPAKMMTVRVASDIPNWKTLSKTSN